MKFVLIAKNIACYRARHSYYMGRAVDGMERPLRGQNTRSTRRINSATGIYAMSATDES